jgi:hypothetical protein
MDEGLAPGAAQPRRPAEAGGPSLAADQPGGSRDALIMQILSTEHFSLLSQRGLAYNEAFTRVGMFLTFVSMSFVALALLSGAMPIDRPFLAVTCIVLFFDLVIGATTFVRVSNANSEDLRAVHGMARIRHGYVELAPESEPYFTTPTFDDLDSIFPIYRGGGNTRSARSNLAYGLSTSGGMLGLVSSLLAGAFAAVAVLTIGGTGEVAIVVGSAAFVVTLALSVRSAFSTFQANRRELTAVFPGPRSDPPGRSS